MVSFLRAVELGADGIEFDVHRTRDGHLVVIHDPTLERTTTGKGFIKDLTLEQVQQADAGVHKGPHFAGQRAPTLRELIRAMPPDLVLFLELKAGSIFYPDIESDLISVLKEEGAQVRTQVSSFDHQALLRIHQLEPGLPLGMLFADNPVDPVAMARACGASALHPYWQWVTPQMVGAAHEAGLQVNTWTVNQPEHIALFRHLGVDAIMSDYPDRL